jgi:hypothetical protein
MNNATSFFYDPSIAKNNMSLNSDEYNELECSLGNSQKGKGECPDVEYHILGSSDTPGFLSHTAIMFLYGKLEPDVSGDAELQSTLNLIQFQSVEADLG